jgi:hypothetical protein
MEVALASVSNKLFGPTGGPDVALFKRFKSNWSSIELNTYEAASDDMFNAHTCVLRAEIITFCKTALTVTPKGRL